MAATPSTATPPSRRTTRATAACGSRSPTRSSSTTGSRSGPTSTSTAEPLSDAAMEAARRTLLAELREHALVLGEVTLSSGQRASYYVDARRALLRPPGFRAAGELIAAAALDLGASAVGGPATAAIPPTCAALAVAAGEQLVGFF